MGALHIHKLRSEYLVSRDHPSPETVRVSLDEPVQRHFADACGQALSSLDADADNSIWMIRCLTLDFPLNASWRPDDIARHWAARLARSVHSTLTAGERFGEVIKFANPADFVAQYVFEIATSGHTDTWYFEPFNTLHSLPIDLAIYEALTRDETTEPALLTLHKSGRIETIARRLSQTLQRRIIQCCARSQASSSPPPDLASVVTSLLAEWKHPAKSNHALLLYTAARAATAAPPHVVQSLVSAIMAISLSLERFSSPTLAEVIEQTASATKPAEYDTLAGLELLKSAFAAKPSLPDQFIQTIRMNELAPTARIPRTHGAGIETACGGVFLLMKSLIDSGADEVLASFSTSTSEAAAFRSMLLLKCLGGDRESLNTGDGAFSFLAANNDFEWPALLEIKNGANPATRWKSLLTALFRRNRIGNNAWIIELATTCASAPNAVVIRDADTDEWLWGDTLPSNAEQGQATIASGLQLIQSICDFAPVQVADASHPDAFRFAPAGPDLDYFHLLRDPVGNLFWSVLARAVTKTFARKLPGFDRSSAAFLRHNFLDIPGSIQIHDSNEVVVTLQRPPLHLVLALAGLDRDLITPPWLEGTTIKLDFTP